jgi:hypothetical protein
VRLTALLTRSALDCFQGKGWSVTKWSRTRGRERCRPTPKREVCRRRSKKPPAPIDECALKKPGPIKQACEQRQQLIGKKLALLSPGTANVQLRRTARAKARAADLEPVIRGLRPLYTRYELLQG